MLEFDIFLKILLTILLGAILGLETETRALESNESGFSESSAKLRIGGLRTYTVLSLFGGIAGLLFNAGAYIFVYILLSGLILFALVAYFLNVKLQRAFGITTEIAIIITFILGFLTTSGLVSIPIILTVMILLTFFLSQKRGLGAIIMKIRHKEVIDLLKFGLVALVILPVLPNKSFQLGDLYYLFGITAQPGDLYASIVLINPFQMWLVVVIISGINLLGYALTRVLGKNKGLLLTGLIGGLISSTSAIISLSIKSKLNSKNTLLLTGVALISNSASFISLGLLLFVSSYALFTELIPVLFLMSVIGGIIGVCLVYFSKQKNHFDANFQIDYEPFSITPALKFVSVIIIIKFFIQILLIQQANSALIISITALSGFAGIDAAAIAFGDLVKAGDITLQTGVLAFILANNINLVSKTGFSYFYGTAKFAKHLGISLLIIAIAGFCGVFL
jgi:uncharacterized membrane protein (DUF4010 family)